MSPSDICQYCGHCRDKHRDDTGVCTSAVWRTEWQMCDCQQFQEREAA